MVSIGLVTYNGEKYIRRSLESLLAQTHKNFELIISDDISTDATFSTCKEFAGKDKRIKLVRQEERQGQLENFRFVANEATGEYFMWAAQDDWWNPKFIEVMKDFLDKNQDYGVGMSSYSRVYDDGEFLEDTKFDGEKNITHLGYGTVLEMMMKKVPIHKFSYGLFRTEILKKMASRPFPKCIAWERVYMCEVAAATHFYSHSEVLYKITTYRKNLMERHGKTDVAKPYFDRFHYTKYIFTVIGRLFSSPIVPFYRKLTIIPVKSVKLIWFGLGRVIHEFSPAVYRFLRYNSHVTK